MTELQDKWNDLKTHEDRLRLLVSSGKKVAVSENRGMAQLYSEHRTGIWPFCVAHALVRSTHARPNPAWYPAAAAFLKSGTQADLTAARGHSCSFGAAALQRALLSFGTIGDFTGAAAFRTYEARQLTASQEKSVQYAMKKELPGLGAWLFCAPFELMALLRPSIWDAPELGNLLMPLGSALARGYGMLRRAGTADVDDALLRDSEPGIRNGLTLLYIARGWEEKLARAAGTTTLFIHHGIAELGRIK